MDQQFSMLDSEESVFFRRQLELVRSRTYDVVYKDLVFRDIVPVDNSGGPGVETITTQIFDQVGMAKIISSYAHDLPRADVKAREVFVPVRTLGSSFGYNKHEIAAAALANRDLPQSKANAARRSIEEKLNNICFGLDDEATASGLGSFLDNVNVPVGNVVNPGSGTEWVNKTPDQILFDINEIFASVHEISLMKERPNKLLLPVQQWNYIVATPRSANSDTTILQYVIANSPYITSAADIIPLNELKGAGTGGVDIMMTYDKNPEKLVMDIPHELEFLDVQIKGLEFVTPAWARAGGVNFFYPLSAAIREGI